MIRNVNVTTQSRHTGILFSLPLLLFILLFSACGKDSNSEQRPSYPKEVTIEYKATSSTGIANFDRVHYTNETGGGSDVNNGSLPFSKKITCTVNADTDLEFVTIVRDGTVGSLTVDILVDGKVVATKTNTSTGGGSFNATVDYHFN